MRSLSDLQVGVPASIHEYVVTMQKHRNKKAPTNYYIDVRQRNKLLELSDAAVILYQHYLSKSGGVQYSFLDEEVAKTLPWKESKIARIRKQLEHEDWFYKIQFPKSSCGRKTTHVYLGQDSVRRAKQNTDVLADFGDEL